MLKVTPVQFKALQAACDALIPRIEKGEGAQRQHFEASASTGNVAQHIIDVIGTLREAEQKEFISLLQLLESKMAGLVFSGKFQRFRDLPPEIQRKVLHKWMRSRFNLLRKAFQTLKKLSMFFHYGHSDASGNPTWKALGYPGPNLAPAAPPPLIKPWRALRDSALDCDVVIVGSGAAGGIAAGMLAEAGQSVILIEKGPMMAGADFTDREADMVQATFDARGALTTKNGSTTIFAGSCLGGGTTINWNGSFPTPDYVLDEWKNKNGLDFAGSAAYQASAEAVMTSIHVNTDNSPHNPQNAALWRGSEKLGQGVEVIARNVDGCQANGCKPCGYCAMGCRGGAKRGTMRTWIERAAAKGAHILVDTTVENVSLDRGIVSGVTAVQTGPDGKQYQLTIRAPRVILAAGSIHTPALLMRSGLSHPHLGRHMYFHPTVAVSGFYKEEIAPWHGVMMSAVNKSGMHVDGNYGYWIETPPLHTGVAALALPWESPQQHKEDMMKVSRMASFIVLTRDKFGGRVTVDKTGRAIPAYDLHPYDRQHLLKGIADAVMIHRAAGAEQVIFPHSRRKSYDIKRSKVSPEDYMRRMASWGWTANRFPMFTAHQMGTCAIGGDPARHPTQPDGQFRGIPGLYVIDGSTLPSSAGVNPMIAIMSMAHWLVKGMI